MRQNAKTLACGCRGQDAIWLHGPVAETAATYASVDLRARQVSLGNALIQMIRIRMLEDRLPGTAGRQRRKRGRGRHVLDRVHADAQMRQQRLRQDFA